MPRREPFGVVDAWVADRPGSAAHASVQNPWQGALGSDLICMLPFPWLACQWTNGREATFMDHSSKDYVGIRVLWDWAFVRPASLIRLEARP